ncbi:hypothetical protein [Deinococcus sp.]|uniref:hypothetical protein n=1 Tax=Deinococcus sp. TaxID=47478 RepID=UPI0025E18FA4|nr:hypothetical protein [Deinococcus sp.]
MIHEPAPKNTLIVAGQVVNFMPSTEHEYLMTTEQVALGYGVSAENVRKHKETKAGELVEGRHWVVSITHTLGGQQQATVWTKRGVVRLGFFIRSQRAKLFRDIAEDLVLRELAPVLPAADFSQLERLAGLTVKALGVVKAEIRAEVTAEIDARLGDLPVTGPAKNEIYKRVKHLVGLMGGRRSDYRAAWSAFNSRYNLAGYGDLPARLQPDALRFVDGLIAAYAPSENLLLEVAK